MAGLKRKAKRDIWFTWSKSQLLLLTAELLNLILGNIPPGKYFFPQETVSVYGMELDLPVEPTTQSSVCSYTYASAVQKGRKYTIYELDSETVNLKITFQ